MKKKILIGAFLLLVLITAIAFIVAAVESYKNDIDLANGIDIMEGMGAAILIVLGGLVILCELDIFFTVYYLLVKPKTSARTVFMLFSQLMILIVIFSEDLAKILSKRISDIFNEEIIVIVPIFFLYVILRIICVATCFSKKE